MPKIKRDGYELTEDQREQPVVWLKHRGLPQLPDTSTETLELACGPGTSKRVKSWGHDGDRAAHWLVTRAGLGLHTDASYARYTHHLVIRNDGFRLTGLRDLGVEALPPLVPGTYYCLDTHSPHEVTRDPRMIEVGAGKPVYKVQIAIDANEVLEPEEVWLYCSAKLGDDVAAGAASVQKVPPRTGKATSPWGLS